VTIYNKRQSETNDVNRPNSKYEQISVTIDENKYFDGNVYYMPKKEYEMPLVNQTVSGVIIGTSNPSFAGARDATTGTFDGSSARYADEIKYSKVVGARANTYNINRYFIEFDTSGISVTPTTAELSLYGFTNSAADLFVVKANFSDGSIGNGDFDSIVGWSTGADNSSNVTKYSSEVTSWSTSGFNDITLNSTALSDMASVDNLKLCLIQADQDLPNNDAVTVVQQTGFWRTTNTIHLDYTAGAAGYGHDVVGVAAANIGKVNGVATANIGKINTVD